MARSMGYFGFVVVRDREATTEQDNQVDEKGDNEDDSETNKNDNQAENNGIGVEENFFEQYLK